MKCAEAPAPAIDTPEAPAAAPAALEAPAAAPSNPTIRYNEPAPAPASGESHRFSDICAFCLKRFEGDTKQQWTSFLDHQEHCKMRPSDPTARKQMIATARRQRAREQMA